MIQGALKPAIQGAIFGAIGANNYSQPFHPCQVPGLRAWYDPSDYSNLFQDSAGTIPVTGVEQQVGLMLDKSGQGNHATQATATSRPILRARYNLLVGTETLATQSITTAATSQRLRFTGSGSVTLSGTATGTYTAGTHTFSTTAGTLTLTVSGVVTQADLRTANDALGMPDYQRVTTNTDYDTVGFLPYLFCDGFDDGMSIAAIDFTNTNKVTIVSGVRRQVVDLAQIIYELSNNSGGINGSFRLQTSNTGAGFSFTSRGTIAAITTTSNHDGPANFVIAHICDISAPSITGRLNGTLAAFASSNQGSGNYGNHSFFLFSRAGSSLPFNGRFYGLTLVGSLLPDSQLQQLERWMNRKTGAF